MDIRAKIVTALSELGVPVYWIKWSGDTNPPDTYITFQTVNRPRDYADDRYTARSYYVYLDLFSETDPYPHIGSIRGALEGAGFAEVACRDVSQTSMSATERADYHVAFTFSYLEVV